jgi:hypothetical protein
MLDRARYNDSVHRYPQVFSPTKPRPVPAATLVNVPTSNCQVPLPSAPNAPQSVLRVGHGAPSTAVIRRGRGFSGGDGSVASHLTPQVMQQLLALPRSAASSANQQQQHIIQQAQQVQHHHNHQLQNHAHLQHFQNDQHIQMQKEAREHLRKQQLYHQVPNRQQQLTQDELLWAGDMQSIAPKASTTAASIPNHSTHQTSVLEASPIATGLSPTEASSPSALSPTVKRSGISSACVVS